MNHYRWLHENDPEALLTHATSCAGPRKLRLILAACLRRALISDQDPLTARHLTAVTLAERFADGQCTPLLLAVERAAMEGIMPIRCALRSALSVPLNANPAVFCEQIRTCLRPEVRLSAINPAGAQQLAEAVWAGARPGIDRWMSGYVRDVLGDVFAPVAIGERWRTIDVKTMARVIYDERDWSRMPVLADALLDAGCEDERVLEHCRESNHARGCWLVDGLLGLG